MLTKLAVENIVRAIDEEIEDIERRKWLGLTISKEELIQLRALKRYVQSLEMVRENEYRKR